MKSSEHFKTNNCATSGGLRTHYGGEKLGLIVVPVSGGMTQRKITLILDFKPDIICCTPSYTQTLCEEFKKLGIPLEEISLKYALLGVESCAGLWI